jgi:hypothetical protein
MFVATFNESFDAPEQVKGLNRASGTGVATNEHDTVFIAKVWIH